MFCKAHVVIAYLAIAVGTFGTVKSDCNLGPIGQKTITASSETLAKPASGVFTDEGWCAYNKQNNSWLEVDFPNGFGAKRFNLSSTHTFFDAAVYPKSVLVQYVPEQGSELIDFPFQSGPLVIELNQTGSSTITIPGFPVKKLRFTLKEFVGEPCMKLKILGCPLQDLCTPSCENGGICDYENHCSCMNGFHGDTCERKPCTPAVLGIYDGRIPQSDIIVSSQDPNYPKRELGLTTGNLSLNKGWCAADYDPSPWIQISLPEPKSITSVIFSYIQGHVTGGVHTQYMETFDLQYIPPTDSSRTPLTFADDIPSLNGTHPIRVTLVPSVVTDTIRIISHTFVKRACFKFEVEGCDPKDLCQAGWCLNGGSCVGVNICKCMQGFIGNRCDKTSTDISTQTITFLNITQGQLFTTLYTFQVTDSVTVKTVNTTNIVVINGANSHIMLDKDVAGSECLTNLDKCQNGFTFSIDVKFGSLVDNTYIVSSGGDLPNHAGIALFYAHKTLTYIVTTTTHSWRLTVSYVPVLNVWQKFEITWNTNLGIGIFLNGKLLSTHSRPQPVSVTETSQFCIGCNPGQTSNVLVNMQISQIHVWTVSRTELVNVGIVQAPIVTTRQPIPTPPSTTKPTSTAKPTTTKQTTLPTTTKLPTPTTPGRGYEIYNMTITGLVGNLLITPAFNFTVHGNPKLELENNSNTALVLDCSKHQYVELADKSIPCLQDLDKCTKGFTFKLEAMFTKLVPSEKTYILSSGGDDTGYSGMSVYLHSGLLTYGVKTGMWHWAASTNVQNTIKTNTWYTFEISWSVSKGLLVLIDGYQVLQSNDKTSSPGAPQSNPVLIGKSPNNNYTSCMKVRNLYTWTIEREVLVTSGILPAQQPLPITMTTNKGPMKLTPYDLTFLRIDDKQIVHTSSFLFQGHGHISPPPKGVSIIMLRGSDDQYMTILNRSIICLDDIKRCHSGFSIEISLQLLVAIQTEKTFIYSSTDKNQTGGVYLYYQTGYLFYGFRYENKLWSGSVKYNLLDYQWHSFILSWSKSDGIILFEKYKVISQTLEAIQQTSNQTTIGTFTIGRGHGPQNSMFQVNNLKFWPYSMGFLIEHNVYTTITTPTTAPTTAETPTTIDKTNLPSTPTISTFLPEIQLVNMTILGKIGDIIITSTYNITSHGSVSLVNDSSAQQMIRIDMSKGGYLEINDSKIVCLGSIQKCDSFALSLDIKIGEIGNNSRIGFISKSPSFNSLGIVLYYQRSSLHFEVTNVMEKQKWIGNFPFRLPLNTWNTFELKWSEIAGVLIYVNKTLLYHGTEKHEFSSESLPPPTPLTIGNTESYFTDAIFYVKNITFGNFNNVSNSYTTKTTYSGTSTIQQPTFSSSTTKYTSIDLKASSNPTTKQQYIVTKNSTTAATSTMTPIISRPINNFLQLNISGNKIYTDKLTLTSHGFVESFMVDHQEVIKFNTSNESYIKVDTKNASCMLSYSNCNGGLSVAANISFIDLQINQTIYIISNMVKGTNVPQLYLYYNSNHLYFGLKVKNHTWSGNVDFSLSLKHWYSFDMSFTPGYGLGLFVNGQLLRLETEQTNAFLFPPSIATGFTVGQTLESGNTTILIGGLNISPTVSFHLDTIIPTTIFFNDTSDSGVTFHGKKDIVRISSTEKAIKLNGSVGSYIEIDSSTNICLR